MQPKVVKGKASNGQDEYRLMFPPKKETEDKCYGLKYVGSGKNPEPSKRNQHSFGTASLPVASVNPAVLTPWTGDLYRSFADGIEDHELVAPSQKIDNGVELVKILSTCIRKTEDPKRAENASYFVVLSDQHQIRGIMMHLRSTPPLSLRCPQLADGGDEGNGASAASSGFREEPLLLVDYLGTDEGWEFANLIHHFFTKYKPCSMVTVISRTDQLDAVYEALRRHADQLDPSWSTTSPPLPELRTSYLVPARRIRLRTIGAEACPVCGSGEACRACGRCGLAWYCSAECQKEDWKGGHKAACCPPDQQLAQARAVLFRVAPQEAGVGGGPADGLAGVREGVPKVVRVEMRAGEEGARDGLWVQDRTGRLGLRFYPENGVGDAFGRLWTLVSQRQGLAVFLTSFARAQGAEFCLSLQPLPDQLW